MAVSWFDPVVGLAMTVSWFNPAVGLVIVALAFSSWAYHQAAHLAGEHVVAWNYHHMTVEKQKDK